MGRPAYPMEFRRMANIYQQAAKQRKLIYLGSIVALLGLSLVVRGSFSGIDRRGVDEVAASPTMSLTLDGRAKIHELTELQQGDKELGGAAIQLLLTGSRGLAICALWNNAIDKQKKQEWNELDISVNSITKLQPHFTAPWLFQSWNLAYNVSVEMDRLDDMYFYIARGISVIAEGESLNRNNPDLRYNVGFYYQNKFGVSDRVTTLRCLYQLSCIPDEDRDPDRLVTVSSDGSRSVNMAAFEEFCRAHPQFIRRLKETRIPVDGSEERAHPLATTPEAVITFLRNNRKLPSRYRPGTRDLKERLKQFPVMPDLRDQPVTTRELNFDSGFADHEQDAFQGSRAWYSLANCSLPPATQKPNNDGNWNPNPLIYRVPKRPATIIFRQGPMRAQTYLAERLTKEGWFDDEPWAIDDLIDPERAWIPKTGPDSQPMSARFVTQGTAQQAWQESAARWQAHGIANGLRMVPSTLQMYVGKAEEYSRLHPGVGIVDLEPPMTPEEAQDERLRDLRDGHEGLRAWVTNRHMTNYEQFEIEAAAMQTNEAILAKKRFFQADKAVRDAAQYSEAMRLFDEGFDAWKKVLVAHQECRNRRPEEQIVAHQQCKDFRDNDRHEEIVYELNVRYVKLAQDVRQRELRDATLWLSDLVSFAGPGSNGNPFRCAVDLAVLANDVERIRNNPNDALRIEARVPQLRAVTPLPLPGPLDGMAPDGTPWIAPDIKTHVREKLGLIKRTVVPPPNPAAGPAPGLPGTPPR
jgi:hypothetical protein